MNKTKITIFLAAQALLMAGCKADNQPASPAVERIAVLERTLEAHRTAESLIADVEVWIERARAEAAPAERERVEALASDLRGRIERLKPEMGRRIAERTARRDLEGDIAALRNAYDRAIASINSERKSAEDAMAATLSTIDSQIKEFRVQIASAGVQGNAEVKRRLSALELSRREAADTLTDLRRSGVDNWAALRRRWEAQVRHWNDDFLQTGERLRRVPTPAPSPSPKPSAAPRAVHH